jgi:hypothetical protein
MRYPLSYGRAGRLRYTVDRGGTTAVHIKDDGEGPPSKVAERRSADDAEATERARRSA